MKTAYLFCCPPVSVPDSKSNGHEAIKSDHEHSDLGYPTGREIDGEPTIADNVPQRPVAEKDVESEEIE